MTINDIYLDLRERGLVASLRGFSRDFLGRAENYAADRGLDRCAPAALVHLHRRLGAERQADLQARVLEQALKHPRLEVGLPLGAQPPVQVHQRRRGAAVEPAVRGVVFRAAEVVPREAAERVHEPAST